MKNCWEIKDCGREEKGHSVDEFGVCPVATNVEADGINSGKFGGRICWAIAGTFCGGEVQGTFSEKAVSCMNCEVYKKVRTEEQRFKILLPNQKYTKNNNTQRFFEKISVSH